MVLGLFGPKKNNGSKKRAHHPTDFFESTPGGVLIEIVLTDTQPVT